MPILWVLGSTVVGALAGAAYVAVPTLQTVTATDYAAATAASLPIPTPTATIGYTGAAMAGAALALFVLRGVRR